MGLVPPQKNLRRGCNWST